MAFATDIPNDRGPRPGYGGASAGPLSRGAGPAIPNNEAGGDRKRTESGKDPAEGGFLSPPNLTHRPPGHGGKV